MQSRGRKSRVVGNPHLTGHRVGMQLPLAEHGCLILANMFWTELIRGTVEVSGVVLDCSNVSVDG